MQYYHDTSGISNGMRNIASSILQRPSQRAAAEAAAQRGLLTEAQIRNLDAKTSTEGMKQKKLRDEEADAELMGQMFKRVEQNPTDAAALADLSEQMGRMFRKYPDPNKVAEGALTVRQMWDNVSKKIAPAMDPNKTLATEQRSETSRANSEASNKTRREIAELNKHRTASPGSYIFNQQTGEVGDKVPSAAAAREIYDTETIVYPGTDSQPGTPAIPARNRLILPDVPAVPATPGVPGKPERRVVRKIPRTLNEAGTEPPTGQPGAWSNAPTNSVPAAAQAVATQHPEGTVLRQKSTGKTFIVKNGQLVEQPQ